MIEKLVIQKLTIAGKEYEYPDTTALVGKFNELIDVVNRLEESVQGVVNNSIADGGRIQSLQEQIHALKTRPENVCEPITLIDMFNEMGRLYADLWNKMEDIHHDLKTKGGDNE